MIRPELRRSLPAGTTSFTVRYDLGPNGYNSWHHHPEVELLLIVRGKGIMIVGDRTVELNPQSHVMMMGSYLPHTISYTNIEGEEPVEAVVIHFGMEFLGHHFLSLPEMEPIRRVLHNCHAGLAFTGDVKKAIEPLMLMLPQANASDRLVYLLRILSLIGHSDEYHLMASKGFIPKTAIRENSRINKVYDYTFGHYREVINIADVASLISLSKESFCRFFKQRTGKPYLQFVTEVRIGHACKLLMENDMNVAEICYACGYNNTSNFHHKFKAVVGKTPLQYQKDYLDTYKGSNEV